MKLTHHPATAIFPMMAGQELQDLASDIKAHGLLQPIVTYDHQVLDGRNRELACRLAGVEPVYEPWQPREPITPVEWIIATNLHRRHLSKSQHAAAAAEALPFLEKEAKERQRTAAPGVRGGRSHGLDPAQAIADGKPRDTHTGRAVVQAAKQFGVGHSIVGQAKRVQRDSPALFEKVKTGEMTVEAAARSLKPKPSTPHEKPFTITGLHARQVAESHKRRLADALSGIEGACMTLRKVDYAKIRAVCSEEDQQVWGRLAWRLAGELRWVREKLNEE